MATLHKKQSVPRREFKGWTYSALDAGPVRRKGMICLEPDGWFMLSIHGFEMHVETGEWLDALALLVEACDDSEVHVESGVALSIERYGVVRRRSRVLIEENGHIKLAAFELEDMQLQVSGLMAEGVSSHYSTDSL